MCCIIFHLIGYGNSHSRGLRDLGVGPRKSGREYNYVRGGSQLDTCTHLKNVVLSENRVLHLGFI